MFLVHVGYKTSNILGSQLYKRIPRPETVPISFLKITTVHQFYG